MAKALLGKAALPDDLPFVTGSVGWLGTAASNDMMTRCDTLLMIGSGFPYTEFLPQEGQARGVQIDINPGMLSLRYPMEVELVGDSAETLRALLPLLEPKRDRSWRAEIEASVRDWREEAARRALQPARSGQSRNSSSTSYRRGSPTIAYSLPIPAPQRSGSRGISPSGPECSPPSRGHWPRWAVASHTLSPPSSPIRIAWRWR